MKKFLAALVVGAMLLIPIGCDFNKPVKEAPIVYKQTIIQRGNVVKFYQGINLNSQDFQRAVDLTYAIGAKKMIIDIHGPGGIIYECARIVNIMDKMKRDGIIVETHCYGAAMSADFIIFVSGSKGYRLLHKNSTAMIHRTQLTTMFGPMVERENMSEDQLAAVERGDNLLRRLLTTAGFDEDEVNAFMLPGNHYFTGDQMIEFGIADGYL